MSLSKPAAARKKTGLRVGVTLFVRGGHQSLWENGIFQNVLFLLMLLRQIPEVEFTSLVISGGGSVDDARAMIDGFDTVVMDMDTAATELDVVIEMSAQLNPDWARAFKARGGRVIGMFVGNNYVIDIERMIHDKPAGFLVSGTPYDEAWTLKEYEATCKPYYEAALRAPVRIVSHLWRPDFLQRSLDKISGGSRFGYQPRASWRVGVFEPNICMVKTCHIPMLAAEFAYRIKPASVEYLRVFSASEIKAYPTFVKFAESLDLVRHGLATFENRWMIGEAMAHHADAVISHHWENGQNYLWYELLWGGYPLIHNSSLLGGCGYRYADFDCEDGGLAYLRAHQVHDANLESYRAEAAKFLQTLDPLNPAIVAEYRAALLRVVEAD